jgi:hypothetical protein
VGLCPPAAALHRYSDYNFLDLVAAVCRTDAAAEAAERAVVDAHLQEKIQAYMQCKQWKRQRLRQRLVDGADAGDDGGGGGGGGGGRADYSGGGRRQSRGDASAAGAAATGVAMVEVRLLAADYVDAKVEALRRVGDARALIATGLVRVCRRPY